MIVLDTNQVDQLKVPRGASYVVLEKIAASSGRELAIPEMALIEHTAHLRHRADSAINKIDSGIRSLARLAPDLPPLDNVPSAHDILERRRELLESRFRILPTPQGAEAKALRREAERQRPAGIDWQTMGTGARDVVVWLTVLSALEHAGGTGVLFVSEDKDFGTDDGLHPELREELFDQDPFASVTLLRGIDALLRRLADQTKPPSDLKRLLATSRQAAEAVQMALAAEGSRRLLNHYAAVIKKPNRRLPDIDIDDLSLSEINARAAYTVGDDTWLSVEGTWTGSFIVDWPSASDERFAHPAKVAWFSAEVTLLARVAGNGLDAVEVIHLGAPQFDMWMFT